jgi:hypothetical protein
VAKIVVDDSRVPLITAIFPDSVTIPDYETLFQRYVELSQQHRRLAWVIDMSRFNPVTAPASVRQGAAGVFERHRDTLTKVSVCEARIVQSPLARGVLTAFDWLTPNKWPCGNFATATEAEAFCRKHLAREGLAIKDRTGASPR